MRSPASDDFSGWNCTPKMCPRSTTAANGDACVVVAAQSAVTGAAYFVDDVTNVLPVQLLPATSYAVWVNSPDDEQLRKFASTAGVPARAYRIRFTTR